MTTALPSLYLSHGSPMIAIEPGPAGRYLQTLGQRIEAAFGRPRAVLVMSPHTATRAPLLLAAAQHAAIHDFGGFPQALFDLSYDAAGAPELAQQAVNLLRSAEIAAMAVPEGGMDHGIWTLLFHMWPQAEVPVLPLSLVPTWTAEQQWRIGQALAPLRQQGVLIVGSGSLTHNLRRYFAHLQGHGPGPRADAAADPDTVAFRDWVHAQVTGGDWAVLRDWRTHAPNPGAAHPSDEHWLPFYFAAGAGTDEPGAIGLRVHASLDSGLLAMDAYAFGLSTSVEALVDGVATLPP